MIMRNSKYNTPEIVGKSFGKRIVVAIEPNPHGGVYWRMKCECGSISLGSPDQLTSGKALTCKSCAIGVQKGPENRGWKGSKYISLTLYNRWKKSAKRRSLSWELTIDILDDLIEKQKMKCVFTGDLLYFDHGKTTRTGNASLDRIDSDIGYKPDNIQFTLKDINMAKQKLSNLDFIVMCGKVTRYGNTHL